MATKITDDEMTSDVTRHTARAWPVPGEPTLWSVTWLPGRALTRSQAITAMTIAEVTAEHADDVADNNSRWWLFIDGWAAELGVTGPHAVAEASLSPEDHEAMRRVRVILPEPGSVGHLLELDAPAGKAAVRFDGQTVVMDACRLQYDGSGEPVPGAGQPDAAGQAPADLDRAALADVMTDHERSWLLAFIIGYAPAVFDAAVAARPGGFADELVERAEAKAEAEYLTEPDGYCLACGANVSWFIGYDGPQHFRGPHKLVTGAERRELFTPEDGHAPRIGWRPPAEEPASGGQPQAVAVAAEQMGASAPPARPSLIKEITPCEAEWLLAHVAEHSPEAFGRAMAERPCVLCGGGPVDADGLCEPCGITLDAEP